MPRVNGREENGRKYGQAWVTIRAYGYADMGFSASCHYIAGYQSTGKLLITYCIAFGSKRFTIIYTHEMSIYRTSTFYLCRNLHNHNKTTTSMTMTKSYSSRILPKQLIPSVPPSNSSSPPPCQASFFAPPPQITPPAPTLVTPTARVLHKSKDACLITPLIHAYNTV